ncbi:MAG: YaiO family outer membrane beta-barrel protein [Hyphomonadaceae bacterium]|nr:YaiO family outer membrane beta-barrel protein [Hyphomonadaceae bacterium]
MIMDTPPAIVCPAHADACAVHRYGCADHGTREARTIADPDDADAWVRLGFARAASHDAAGAEEAFARALAIAPGYDDAKLGLAQLAYRAGDLEEARRWLGAIGEARRADPDVAALSRALSAAQSADVTWRVDASIAYSALSDDLDPWREATVSLARRKGDTWWGGGVEVVERFRQSDVFGELRFTHAAGHGAWGIALGGASDPLFKPEVQARLEYATPEGDPWRFAGALTLAEYQVGAIHRLGLSASHERDMGARVTVRSVAVRDERDDVRFGYGVSLAARVHDDADIEVSWSDAPESSEGATVDVQSLALGGSVAMTPRLRLRVAVAREQREAFDRTEITAALARTF